MLEGIAAGHFLKQRKFVDIILAFESSKGKGIRVPRQARYYRDTRIRQRSI